MESEIVNLPKTDFRTLPQYFDKEMKEELYVAYARREAYKMIRRLEKHKIASNIEHHIQNKFKDQIVGS